MEKTYALTGFPMGLWQQNLMEWTESLIQDGLVYATVNFFHLPFKRIIGYYYSAKSLSFYYNLENLHIQKFYSIVHFNNSVCNFLNCIHV